MVAIIVSDKTSIEFIILGDLVVGFYEELLETVMLPQALYDEFHVTEFEDLDQGNQR